MDKIINSAIDIALKNKKPLDNQGVLYFKADRTGLEPATSAVTGRHSNQLNYRSQNFQRRFRFRVAKIRGKKFFKQIFY
jgi:hypothetical protein